MKRRRLLLGVGLAALAAASVLDHGGFFGYRPGERTRYERAEAPVSDIVSVNILELELPDGDRPTTRVRLRGVAPPDDDVPAMSYLREKVLDRRVRLHFDPNRAMRDADGNLSAYVYLLDGVDDALNPPMLNDLLIFEGLARADRARPHVFAHTFDQREKLAQRANRGTWGSAAAK